VEIFMGFFTSKRFDTLDELLIAEVKDLYDAEIRLTDALPKMAEAADAQTLKNAFRSHLAETEGQVTRLEQVFQILGVDAERETCDAMKGLISEGDDFIGASGDPAVLDAALIGAAQRVEHYEMAGYGTARSLAKQLGKQQVADLLQQTLDEEGAADKKLTEIAETYANVAASRS
jgi:ferritin-like metal-binding protein YciE